MAASSSSVEANLRRSPRLSFNKVNLRNITVRSRRKQIDRSRSSTVRGETDSQVPFYERPAQCDEHGRFCSAGKLENRFLRENQVDEVYSEDDISHFDMEISRQSSPKTRKIAENASITNKFASDRYNNYDPVISKNLSKSLFSNEWARIKECVTCKKQFITTTADTHCKGDGHESYHFQANRTSRVSDVESCSSFQPPFSSTKVYKTSVSSRLLDQPNLELSGIKELKSPLVNESGNEDVEFDSNPIELRIIPSDNDILVPDSGSGHDNENAEDDDDLPFTQPVTTILLRGVVAFVDVKIGNLKISDKLKQQLITLGAEVEEKFTKRVTHVIFKDGNLSTYKKAKRWKVPLVSLTWINDCTTALSVLPTSNYTPYGLDKYEAKLVNSVIIKAA